MVIPKADIAQEYFPRFSVADSLRQLRRTIKSVPGLDGELAELSENLPQKRHYFTKEEVDVIRKYLGEP